MDPSDPLSYRVVFDVSRQLPQGWWGFLLPPAMVAVIIRFGHRDDMKLGHIVKPVLVGAGIFLSIAIGVITWISNSVFRSSLEHGNYRVVEGTVAEFVPEEPMVKRPETFMVVSPAESVCYSYSRWIGNGGLNRSHGHIRNGVQVRILDVRGRIARLEIADEPPQK